MAYDAAAAGCFLMFLGPWGTWEENVQKVFENNRVGYDLDVKNAKAQLIDLMKNKRLNESLKAAHDLPELYRQGCKNLIELHATKPCLTTEHN